MPEFRRAARLVLIDGAERVLLFRHAESSGREFWATPGGGLEGSETLEQAARREAAEELGVRQVNLRELWGGRAEFSIGTRQIVQEETFFLLDGHWIESGEDVEAVHRREGIRETRWWSLAEIETTEELVFPSDLASQLRVTLLLER